jgi:ELWxxDGT repeat protein
MTTSGNKVFFIGTSVAAGKELWVSDGTSAGTRLVNDINPGTNSSDPQHIVSVADGVVFDADDGVHGRKPWWSDGTSTELLGPYPIQWFGDGAPGFAHAGIAFFIADIAGQGPAVVRSDGTASGTYPVRSNSIAYLSSFVGVGLYTMFVDAGCPGASDIGMWRTDGTVDGTACVLRLDAPAHLNSDALSAFSSGGGQLFFPATDPRYGVELWSAASAALLSGTVIATETPTATPTATGTPTPINTATPASVQSTCVGDCHGTGIVDIGDLITGVDIVLGTLPTSACAAFENTVGAVDIAQLLKGVANSLGGCPLPAA